MKSELERVNSWAPFVERIESALQRKDFRPSTVRSLFRFVDPLFDTEAIGWKNALFYLFFWNTTEKGRCCRYLIPLRAFMERSSPLFRNAPSLVIQRYNQFIEALVGQQKGHPYFFSQEWARKPKSRRERWMEKGKKGEELFVSALQQAHTKVSAHEKNEPLFLWAPWEETTSIEMKETPPSGREASYFLESGESEDRFHRPPFDRFLDLLSQPDSSLHKRLEERKRLLEEFLVRKRTLTYQLLQIQEEDPLFDAKACKKALEDISFEGPFFEKGVSSDEAARRIESLRSSFSDLEESLRQHWKRYSEKSVNQCLLVGHVSVKLAFQLWTFLGHDLVWNDMEARVASVQKMLAPIVHSFFESASNELIERLFYQMIQLDDIKALSGELVSRAFREKDLVESAEELLQDVVSLFVLSSLSRMDRYASDFKNMIASLAQLMKGCMTPTKTFSHLLHREDVALLFRDSWALLEEIRTQCMQRKEQLLASITEEKRQAYVRCMYSFLSEVEHATLAPIGELFASFQKEESKSISLLLEWQRTMLQPKIGKGSLLISILGFHQRKRCLACLASSRMKAEAIEDFARSCLAAVHSDAPFLQTLLWNMHILLPLLLVQAVTQETCEENSIERSFNVLFDQMERSLKLWWLTTPLSIKNTDPVLLSRVENHTLWRGVQPKDDDFSLLRALLTALLQDGQPTYKGLVFTILLSLYDLFEEIKRHEGSFSECFLSRMSGFLKMMIKELLTNRFRLSPMLNDVLSDILHEMDEKRADAPGNKSVLLLEILKETASALKEKSTQEQEAHTFPLIGDASFFFND